MSSTTQPAEASTHDTESSNIIDQALVDAGLLLAYAANSGIEIPDSAIATITHARHVHDTDDWTEETEAQFWSSYAKLAAAVQPVTVSSLLSMKASTGTKGSLSGIKTNMADDTARSYRRTALFALTLMLFTQIYWLMGTTTLHNIEEARAILPDLEVRFARLSTTVSEAEFRAIYMLTEQPFATTLSDLRSVALQDEAREIASGQDGTSRANAGGDTTGPAGNVGSGATATTADPSTPPASVPDTTTAPPSRTAAPPATSGSTSTTSRSAAIDTAVGLSDEDIANDTTTQLIEVSARLDATRSKLETLHAMVQSLNFFNPISWLMIITQTDPDDSVSAASNTVSLTSAAGALSSNQRSQIRAADRNLHMLDLILQTMQIYFLPLLYGLLGASAYILRTLSRSIRDVTYEPSANIRYGLRLFLGALSGLAIGWFIATPSTSATAAAAATTLSGTQTAETGGLTVTKTVQPLALAFLAGYSVELLFTLMDKIVNTFTSSNSAHTKQAGG